MAVSLSVIAAKDSAGTAIAGGLQAQDKSGAGTGPFTLGHIMIDGLAGTNMAAVTAANAVKVDGSAVTQPVSIATAPALVASSAIIGKVGIDQTTPGTTNAVSLSAETTKVIGVTRTADGSGNLVTSTANAMDVNIKSGLLNAGAAVSASSAPSVLATDQATLSVAFDSTQLMNGKSGVALSPTKVKISVASATTTTLVALVTSKKIRILALYLVSTAANTVTFQSHTTTSNSDGGSAFAANGGICLPFNPIGWFDTTAGEALDMVTSGAGQVSGQFSYVAI
jgi:hypothetical protein